MRRAGKYAAPLFLIILTVSFFYLEEPVFTGIRSGIALCLDTVIPSLFPFMIISKLAVGADILRLFRRPLSAACRFLFHLPPPCADIFIFSLIGGYPVGAVLAKESFERGEITEDQLQSAMRFCVAGGPGFIIGGVGKRIFNSAGAGAIIYFSCLLSCLLCGIISGRFTKYHAEGKKISCRNIQPVDIFVSSVSSSCRGLLNICSYVVLFSAVTAAVGSLNIPAPLYRMISIPLEVTGGAVLCASSCGLPLTAALLSFGGIAIHCQIFSFLHENLKLSDFLFFRLLSALLTYIFARFLISLYSPAVSVYAPAGTVYSPALQSGAMPVLLVLLSVFMIISSSGAKEKIDFTCRL